MLITTTTQPQAEMGWVPLVVAGLTALPAVLNFLSPHDQGPSAEQIAAMQAAAEAERKRQQQSQLMWGAGLLGVGVLAAVLISRG